LPEPAIRVVATRDLRAGEIRALRALFAAAWGNAGSRFDDDDWRHATGGTHVLAQLGREIVAHGALVTRVLEIGGRPMRVGYVEAVATQPGQWGRGHASRVMERIDGLIRDQHVLGALSTGAAAFYERLGWERWRGPTFVRTATGLERTPDDDGAILVLRTPRTPPLDLDDPIACDWRPGDVW
jgi:aminoglycoside 2'-N-acetyltransferase I